MRKGDNEGKHRRIKVKGSKKMRDEQNDNREKSERKRKKEK